LSDTPKTILFVHSGQDWVRGSERVLLDLASHLPAARFRPVVWCNSPALRDACLAAAIPLVSTPFPAPPHQPWWRASREAIRQAIEVIGETSAALVHVNTLVSLPWALRGARRVGVGVIAHLHTPTTTDERVWCGLHQVNVAVGVSRFSLSWVESDGLDPKATRLIYNAVFPERLEHGSAAQLRGELGIPADAVVAATVGSLIPRKDIATVIAGVSGALRSGLPIHLLILGTGEELELLRALTASLGVSDRVHFLGDRDDVGAILRDATDFLISAAREETLGLNVIEAGFFGLPCVVSDIPPHREIVAEPATGLLFRPGDSDDLALKLELLLRDPSLRDSLGTRAKVEIRQRFLPDRFLAEFTDLYDDVTQLRRERLGWLAGFRFPRGYWRFGLQRLGRWGSQ